MLAVFARVEPALRKSITFDNDTAFAQHALLRTMRAHASWQKGGVENANGRLRRWLPRQTDIDKVSDEEIQDIRLSARTEESSLQPRCVAGTMMKPSRRYTCTRSWAYQRFVSQLAHGSRSDGAAPELPASTPLVVWTVSPLVHTQAHRLGRRRTSRSVRSA
jgi:hypothetical protein